MHQNLYDWRQASVARCHIWKIPCNSKTIPSLLVFLGLLLCMPSQNAHAQAVSATLVGTVSDTTGAGVPGAKISIQEVSTGITRQAVSNESGNYTFPDLTPGTYSVV